MPVKRPQLVNGEIYHVILRGIDDNLIFKDVNDYYKAQGTLDLTNVEKTIFIFIKKS